jgi:hypothetical protein
MWVLLSATVRRWVILSVAIPIAAKLLTVLAERLERRNGPTRLSNGLRRAGSLASTGRRPNRPRATAVSAG